MKRLIFPLIGIAILIFTVVSVRAMHSAPAKPKEPTQSAAPPVAEVERLEALLDKTRVIAPIDGVVVERTRHAGESVTAGEAIITIADLSRTRIEAEIDEFDSAHIVLGGRVSVTAEGFDKS